MVIEVLELSRRLILTRRDLDGCLTACGVIVECTVQKEVIGSHVTHVHFRKLGRDSPSTKAF